MIWTEERRRKQADAIRRWRPWERSTGPRTTVGKAQSSRNAYKASVKQQLREIAAYVAQLERERRKIVDVEHDFSLSSAPK